MDHPDSLTLADDSSDTFDLRQYYYLCNAISPHCPVEATTLGYFPNRGINIFFAIGFGLAGLATLVLGIWKRTWSYTAFITAGCMLEMAGYAARVPLADNPWNKTGFQTQIVAVILAPTLVCISVYLTLKHVCLALNPGLSRVRPGLYPFIFVPLDVSCLVVQAIGGILAASAGDDFAMLRHGNRAIIAGIALQVVVLLFFGSVAADYFVRVRRWIRVDGVGEAGHAEAVALWRDKKFRLFVYAVVGAYCGILIRCIYRIAEMAGGWGNHIMQDEPSFIVLEGFMVLIACCLLAAFPPGFLFPQMAANMAKGKKTAPGKSKQDGGVKDAAGTEHGDASEGRERDVEKNTEAGESGTQR